MQKYILFLLLLTSLKTFGQLRQHSASTNKPKQDSRIDTLLRNTPVPTVPADSSLITKSTNADTLNEPVKNKHKAFETVKIKPANQNSNSKTTVKNTPPQEIKTAIKSEGTNPIFNHNASFYTGYYEPIKCYGKIPADFATLSSRKYQNALQSINKQDRKSIRKVKNKFYLESAFDLDQLLLSGSVTFNDSVTVYLNKVLDGVLTNNKPLRDSLRIYTLKSNVVNAITTPSGIILVTTGLLSKVENEAQLAYILCHEAIHYKNKHSITAYVEEAKRDRRKGTYSGMSDEERRIAHYAYSKDLETEADLQGLEIFKKSYYSLTESVNSFYMLKSSTQPFGNDSLDRTFFNHAGYVLPGKLFLDELKPREDTTEEEDDAYKTHPNINKRINNVIDKLGEDYTDTKPKYVISEPEFKRVQQICRYESCLLYLTTRRYSKAFISAYILLKSEPSNLFLHKIIAKSLYGIAKYKTNYRFDEVQFSSEMPRANLEQVYHVFKTMESKETTVLALRYVYYVLLKDPADETMNMIFNDLIYEAASKYSLHFYDICAGTNTQGADTTKANKRVKLGSLRPSAKREDYYKYALAEFTTDAALRARFETYSTYKATFVRPGKRHKYASDTLGNVKNTEIEDIYNSPRYSLNDKDVILVDPNYIIINEAKKSTVRYQAAETAEINLKNNIDVCAKACNLNVYYLESKGLADNEVEKFNDIASYNYWLSEQFAHSKIYFVNSHREYAVKVCDKYKSDNIATLQIVNYKIKKKSLGIYFALVCLVYPIPFIAYYLITPDINTLYFATVSDVRQNKLQMVWEHYTKMRDNQGNINSNLYYILSQVKGKK